MQVTRVIPATAEAQALFASARAELERHGPSALYFRLLGAAAVAGSIDAISDLAEWLLEGRRGRKRVVLARAPRRAVQLLRRAAAERKPSALLTLANCYADGTGTRRNLAAAARYYRLAARAGEPFAAFNLATLHRDRGDRKKERYWLRRAHALGDPLATLVIAEMDLVGRRANAAQRARAYLRRMTRSSNELVRDEATEILEHLARTGCRRWQQRTPAP
jgi:TPR repeat protein